MSNHDKCVRDQVHGDAYLKEPLSAVLVREKRHEEGADSTREKNGAQQTNLPVRTADHVEFLNPVIQRSLVGVVDPVVDVRIAAELARLTGVGDIWLTLGITHKLRQKLEIRETIDEKSRRIGRKCNREECKFLEEAVPVDAP